MVAAYSKRPYLYPAPSRRIAVSLVSVISFLLATVPSPAESSSVTGLAFFDYFYNVSGSGIPADSGAFAFRRIYLTYDSNIDDRFSARFRLEADGKELTSKGKLGVFVKDASLKWTSLLPNTNGYIGLTATPLWSRSEKVWGYRSVEKTILDLRGLGTSADVGVALEGNFKPASFHVLLANGSGQAPENSRSKKIYASVPVFVGKGMIEAVADYEALPGARDRHTLKAFLGYPGERAALGVEWVQRTNRNAGTNGADVVPLGVSVFARVKAGPPVWLFARYDFYDPDSELDADGYREHLWLGGLDWGASKNVHFIPNLSVVSYDAKDAATADRDADVVARLTVAYNYE